MRHHLSMRHALWLAFAVYPLWAQSVCEIPADVRTLSAQEIRDRLGNPNFFLYVRLLDVTPNRPKPGVLAAEFERLLQTHPDDAEYEYLFGRSLIGKSTPAAIVHLNRAVSLDPKLPWPYIALTEIYASRNFRDEAKQLVNLRTYHQICPRNLDAFRFLGAIKDAEETARWANELRALLENTTDSQHWKTLWAAEFRIVSASEHDAVRKKVAADVLRLESLPETGERRTALAEGYKLIGRPEQAERLANPDGQAFKAYQAWEAKHNLRTGRFSEQEYDAIFLDEAKAAQEWVKQFPTSRFAWQQRLSTLMLLPNWTKQQLEEAGDRVLAADAANPFGWTIRPTQLHVAQVWVKYGVRLRDCLAIAERAFEEISQGPEEPNDLFSQPNKASEDSFPFDYAVWQTMDVVVDASAQLKEFAKSRSMLAKMQQWLKDNEFKKDERSTGYTRFHAAYLYCEGMLAEAEGRKLDATALYARAKAGGWWTRPTLRHSLELWKEQGGTEEGWKLATQPFPAPRPPTSAKSAITPATGFAAWKDESRTLPEMRLLDTKGRTWTLTDFNGKKTFVNLWATWCGPCRDELPSLQKLYDLLKDKPGIQLITLNMDENPGQVQPFLTANGYTFPVLFARQYVETFLKGQFTIPQNWIVDSSAVLKQGSVGFDTTLKDWPNQMLAKLQ